MEDKNHTLGRRDCLRHTKRSGNSTESTEQTSVWNAGVK